MKANKKKGLVIVGISLLALLFTWKAFIFFIHDFSVENISYDFPQRVEHNLIQPEQVQDIIRQPFSYLDQGTQTYVFISQDQKYVLKFFKFRHLKPSWNTQWLSFIPWISRHDEWHRESRQRKLDRLFSGYQLAYERDRENNALVFLHLSPTSIFKQHVVVFDRYGFKHEINLDDVVFVLQERGEAAKDVISKLLEAGDIEKAKKRFRQILDLYVLEYNKGIWDRDHNVMHNTGFVGEKPIRIDVGRLRADERFKHLDFYKSDLEKVGLKRIDRWLYTHYPKYRDPVMNDVRMKLQEIFNHFDGPPEMSKDSQ